MTDYARANTGGATHFTDKDGLTTGDPDKLIVGSEHDSEFNAALTAINTKYDSADRANQAEAEAGTTALKVMTPQGVQYWGDDNAGVIGDWRALADPGVDALAGWDDSGSVGILFTLGAGITSSGTVITSDDSAIVHDSLSGFVANEHIDHTSVSMGTTAPLSGGGTIAATRALVFDISGLSTLTSETVAAADIFLVDDGAGGTNKSIAFQDFGPRVVESSSKTLGVADGNTMFVNTGAAEDTITIPLDAATDLNIGFQVGLCTQSTGAILIADGGTTVSSLSSNLQVKASGGGAYLIKTGADTWSLIGDLEA